VAAKEGGRRLVIVESPTKATKIASFLGDGYIVESSRGHVRDLPTGASEVPAKYKGEKWARTGVDVDNGFEPLYVVNPTSGPRSGSLKDALADADELLLATDGDREGEAIAWHLLQELKPKVPARRMVFHEITPHAIAEAVANPRDLDEDLVDAQETRRILDRCTATRSPRCCGRRSCPAVGRPRAVGGDPAGRRPGAGADRFPVRVLLGSRCGPRRGRGADPPLFPARLTRSASDGSRRVATSTAGVS
jgi:DNA topoisomerase-1